MGVVGRCWALLGVALLWPLAVALGSPYLAYRSWIYIGAGFAGIVALGLLLIQPLAAHRIALTRRAHRVIGAAIIAAVSIHVGGLWLTSPPDVIDALLLRSPTPFALWGVIALWAMVALGIAALFRRRMGPLWWRRMHAGLLVPLIGGTVLHAVLIEGAMGQVSKAALCALVVFAALWAVMRMRLR